MMFKEKNFKSLLFHYLKKFFIIFVSLFLVLLLLIYFAVFKNSYEELDTNNIKTCTQASTFAQSAVKECDRTYNALVANNNITQFLHTDIHSLDKKDYSDMVSTVKNILLSNQLSSAFTKDILVVSQKNNIAISASSTFPSTVTRLKEYDFFENFIEGDDELIVKSIYDESDGVHSNNLRHLICRKIDSSFESGFVLFEIDSNKLKSSISSVLSSENMFFIFNEEVFVSSDKTDNLAIEDITEIKNKLSAKKENKAVQYKDYQCFNMKMEIYGLEMLIFLKNSDYRQLTQLSIFVFIVIFLIFLFLSLWISYILSKNTMNPIMEIINIIDNPQKAGSDIKINQSEEVQYITQNILKSVEDNKYYKEQLEKKLVELDKSQEIALHNQIQPHFLFNTLETIYAVAFGLTKSENAAAKMIRMLSELLRVSFRDDKKFVAIGEEINHIKNYLDIQALRYSDRFEVMWDIEENILDFSTVKLILQPVCENAIYHGIKNVEFFCYIKISAKENKRNNTIVFKVENTGKTIDKNLLISLKQALKDDNYSTEHIGLKNVNRRIKIAFGEKYGCDIFSDKEKTTVIITIPKTKII